MTASSVDLPQPEGPSSTANSPFSTVRSMPFSTSTGPKRLCTPRTLSAAMSFPYLIAPAVRPRRKYCPPKK